MISVSGLSKSFFIPRAEKRSVKGSLFHLFQSKGVKRIDVIKDLDLKVSPGEFVGVMGPNGSGKSTLLKILAGVYSPDKGAVQVSGKVSSLLELGVGFNPELPARENVYLNGLLMGIPLNKLKQCFREIFQFAELEDFMDTPLKFYSSGMASRLAFAVALQVDAEVYLLDEVLAVGDEAFQEKCKAVFRDLKRQGKTVLFVSHSQALVDELCDRVITMSR